MEEPKATPQTQIPNPPPNSVRTPPHLQSKTKKRLLDSDAQNSSSFKIRALLRDIRPNVLEVLLFTPISPSLPLYPHLL